MTIRLKTVTSDCKEIFMECGGATASVTTWANQEGASLMLHGKGDSLRMAGALRWEEIDMVIAALAAARAL